MYKYILTLLILIVLTTSCTTRGHEQETTDTSPTARSTETTRQHVAASPTTTTTSTETPAAFGLPTPPTQALSATLPLSDALPMSDIPLSPTLSLSDTTIVTDALLVASDHFTVTDTPAPMRYPGGDVLTITLGVSDTLAVTSEPPLFTETDEEELARLKATQRIPQDRVALARALGGKPDAFDTVNTTLLTVTVGHIHNFWVSNLAQDENYTVTAELRYAGPVVLMYVEQGLAVDQGALEQAATTFEQNIYPLTRSLFGSEWQPGVDGDPRITILNVAGRGDSAIGYFSSRDSTPRHVNPYSNEREMFYMKVLPGNPVYLPTLAHEFQHMIHWNEQRGSATWFQEGCSKLSEDLNGYGNDAFVGIYLTHPDTQLNSWPESAPSSHIYYGAANLFMRYLYAQYTGHTGLVHLIRANPSNNLDAFVQTVAALRPDITSFRQLFGDWAVATLVNDVRVGDGRYTYDLLEGTRRPPGGLALLSSRPATTRVTSGVFGDTVSQFGVDYLELPPGPLDLEFTGNLTVSLLGGMPQGRYSWWSVRGDNSLSTLTRAFDLRDVSSMFLHVNMWYELEKDYDYAFVSVSTDGGNTWQTLEGRHTTRANPQGANYGHGYTGVSNATPDTKTGSVVRGEWITETFDLSAYIGQEILLRFWQINDEAYNADGLMLDMIRLCRNEAGDDCLFTDDVETDTAGWQAEGFVRVDGIRKQDWELRLVRTDEFGTTFVDSLPVNEVGQASAFVEAGQQAVLVVSGASLYTMEKADYRLTVRKRGTLE